MANQSAPAPADQMMQHQKAKAAEPELKPEGVGQQIGLPELRQIEKATDHSQHQSSPASDCRHPLKSTHIGSAHIVLIHLKNTPV